MKKTLLFTAALLTAYGVNAQLIVDSVKNLGDKVEIEISDPRVHKDISFFTGILEADSLQIQSLGTVCTASDGKANYTTTFSLPIKTLKPVQKIIYSQVINNEPAIVDVTEHILPLIEIVVPEVVKKAEPAKPVQNAEEPVKPKVQPLNPTIKLPESPRREK